MYIYWKGRYSKNITAMERIIPLDEKPMDRDTYDIEPGNVVELVYRPWLTFVEREYKGTVVDVGKSSFVVEVYGECPDPLLTLSRRNKKRRFWFRKTKMHWIGSSGTVIFAKQPP